jgi:signal transduction histidine kinase
LINVDEDLKRILKAGFRLALVVAAVFAISLLFLGQSADFRALREINSRSCVNLTVPAIDGLDTRMLRCQSELVVSANDPAFWHATTAKPADLALLAPIFRDSLIVTVNGMPVGQARLNQLRMPARLATVPAIIPIPATALKLGNNRLEIVVSGLAGRDPIIGKLYIGREEDAVDQFRQLRFVGEVLPTLILGGQAALSLIFFTIWNRRRQETAFGWFGLVLLLDTLRGSAFIPAFGAESTDVSYWSLLVPFSAVAYLMFACALAKLMTTRWIWLAWLGPILVTAVAAISSPEVATVVLLPMGIAVVFCNLLCATGVLAIGWSRLMLLGSVLFAALVLYDVLLSLQVIDGHMALARPGLLVLLVAMVTLMINRFTGAMTELDRGAETLKIRTTQMEAQLRLADQELREEREFAILARERARLMRDLHDGLGGEMVAVLALAERDGGKVTDIAYHARAALADMRLIIASLEDYGGDLAMALAVWKERAEPQIRAAGMTLHWELGESDLSIGFGPAHILDILRIFQEALTNVIQHSDATSITVRSKLADDQLILTFSDDGKGIGDDAAAGKGLANMRCRALELGAEFTIEDAGPGTTILLRLPLHTPAGTSVPRPSPNQGIA